MSEAFLHLRDPADVWLRDVPLRGDRLVIGRSPRVDVVLESGHVSRQHAELTRDPGGAWWIRDLGSVNGTLVNGVVLVRPHALALGDRVEIEGFTLLYRA